ncbi:MAG: SDR family NAD(P)-dependent oxidoreductase [Daejeonella sp.]
MVIITGASRGIGSYLYNSLKQSEQNVYGTFNSTEIDSDDNLHKVDILNHEEVREWLSSLTWNDDQITLINCAGTTYSSFAHKADVSRWNHVIDVNLKGTFNVINCILPKMRDKKFGRIINLSSVVAQLGVVGTSSYAASKAALWGMSKSIAAENAKLNITINNINLGYFNIGMIGEVPETILADIKAKIPSGELGNPSDILATINFLRTVSYTNGTEIDLNGGLY